MAGDWIPMRVDLPEDPAVITIAAATGLTECAVVGMLHRLWSWANKHLSDGNARGVTAEWIDRYLATPGFAAAMLDAGWLRTRSGGVEFPNFDRWNSQGAKRRVLTAQRVKRSRTAKCNAPSVTKALPEKRREEKNIEEANASSCPEPAKPPDAGPPVMTFPVVGKGVREWHLSESKLGEYRESFPGVDVLAELRAARQWCLDNEPRRKTPKGMPAFLGRWLGKAQDRGPSRLGPTIPIPVPGLSPNRAAIEAKLAAKTIPGTTGGNGDGHS